MEFLKVDKKLPGQNYCLLSFVEPEDDIFEKKETFYFNKFIKSAAEKYKFDSKEFIRDYLDFKKRYVVELQEDFNKAVGNKTNIRGVKVRGVFETYEEADYRAKQLRENEEHFHIFTGQVGYWLPFNPQPDLIENQEYLEKELNELIKNHTQNQIMASKLFEDRKKQLIEQATKEGKKIDMAEINKQAEEIVTVVGDSPLPANTAPVEGDSNLTSVSEAVFNSDVEVSKSKLDEITN
jgi:hypothetical protein